MPPRLLAALSLVAAMALTGANVAFGKAIAAAIPVYIFVLFRFVVASLALGPMAAAEPGPKLAQMSRGEWRDLMLMALLGLVGFTVLMLEGLKRTAAADAGIITATLPAVVAALGVSVRRRPPVAPAGPRRGLGRRGPAAGAGHERAGRRRDAGRQPAGGGGRAVRGELRHPRQAAGAALPAATAGARGQPGGPRDGNPARAPRRAHLRSARRDARDVAARHLVRALGQRVLPVAVVWRIAARGDLAGRPGDGGDAGRRACHLRALPGRGHRPGAPRGRSPGDRGDRAGGAKPRQFRIARRSNRILEGEILDDRPMCS